MQPTQATLERHAQLINAGHRTYCLNHSVADELAEFVEDHYDVRTEIEETDSSIIVQAVNADRIRELSAA